LLGDFEEGDAVLGEKVLGDFEGNLLGLAVKVDEVIGNFEVGDSLGWFKSLGLELSDGWLLGFSEG
jgi:hypothetical protein